MNTKAKIGWALAAGAAGLGVAAAIAVALAPRTSGAAGEASVTGKVTFAGAASTGLHAITKNPEVCAAPAPPAEEIVKGAGNGLANVVVSIAAPPPAALPKLTVTVDQIGCRYVPHVQAATVGSDIVMKNSDPVLHNVHTYLDGAKTLFNVGMPIKGMTVKKPIKAAGVVSLACDAGHTWMSAYVLAFNHPYFAVTGADGTFKIDGVPAGTYEAAFWHEKLGTKKASVNVLATGAVANLAF